MTTRDTAFAPGTPCWVDLFTSDPEAAKAFYGNLFGWTAQEGGPEFGGYVNFASEGRLVAGMMGGNIPESGRPDSWNTYMATSDIDSTVASSTGLGATLIAAPMQVADLGSMAVLADPVGGVFGAWMAGTHTGFAKYNEPGSVTWDEYHSKEFAATKDFYAKVFGWDMQPTSDTDDFRYFTANIDGEGVAGMMDSHSFLPAEVPSHWAVYFSVADTDASAQKVVELGGQLLRPVDDSPFGRLADVLDCNGAAFKLHMPPRSAS